MGTRACKFCMFIQFWDHPHAYGDKLTAAPQPVRVKGSSPRVWGQDSDKATVSSTGGIIPTRMGTRQLHCQREVRYRDHPHAYGDKRLSGASATRIVGSSPRVWGQV